MREVTDPWTLSLTDMPGHLEARDLLLLDLDQTVRHNATDPEGFVNTGADVAVYPQAVTMMQRHHDRGGRIAGVSNQGGLALGHVDTWDCQDAMARTQDLCGGLFDLIMFCPHYPSVERCWCRKPAPGMLIYATLLLGQQTCERYPLDRILMVGDRDEDEQAAAAAGVSFLDAQAWRARADVPEPDGPAGNETR